MISCAEAVQRLWEYVERAPSAGEQAALEEHLALCRRCCGEAGFAEELRGFLARHACGGDLPLEVDARLNLLLDRLEEAP